MARDNPITRRLVANGLEHRVTEWAAVARPSPTSSPSAGTALLLHGFMDAAASWDLVAPKLAAEGLRVIAPDLRGFGDAPRTPRGSYYHFPEYVADVADVVDELVAPEAPLFVVGHSMGGTVASLYAGTFPNRVSALALLEGMGPPDTPADSAPDRMRRWIEDQRKFRNEPSRSMRRDEAERRLLERHPNVSRSIIASRVHHLAAVADASTVDGDRVHWKFDPLHRSVSPFPFFLSMYRAFASRVTAPTLIVGGGPEGFHTPDEADRIAAFAKARVHDIAGAGHMMHWTKPDELAAVLLDFWKSALSESRFADAK